MCKHKKAQVRFDLEETPNGGSLLLLKDLYQIEFKPVNIDDILNNAAIAEKDLITLFKELISEI